MPTTGALLAACKVIVPELPVPGSVIAAVTPLGSGLKARVTLPLKLVRDTLTVIAGALVPCARVTDDALMLAMPIATGLTVRVNVAVADTIPAPLAVIVTI